MPTLFPKLAVAFALASAAVVRGQAPGAVTVVENEVGYVLDNGTITALVSKKSGDLISMKFKGVEQLAVATLPSGQPDLQADPPGDPGRGRGMTDHMYGFWSHD